MKRFSALGLVIALFLLGCGGGGGSDSTSQDETIKNDGPKILTDASVAADESLNFLVLANSTTATDQQKEAVALMKDYVDESDADLAYAELNKWKYMEISIWRIIDFNVFNGLELLDTVKLSAFNDSVPAFSTVDRPEKIDLGNLKYIPNLKTLKLDSCKLEYFKNLAALTTLETVSCENSYEGNNIDLLAETKAKNLSISVYDKNPIDASSLGNNKNIEYLGFKGTNLLSIPNLSGMTNLKNLSFDYATTSVDGDLSNLGKISSLTALTISGKSIDSSSNPYSGVPFKINTLPVLPNLSVLNLNIVRETQEDDFLSVLKNFGKLEYLYLTDDDLYETETFNIPSTLRVLSITTKSLSNLGIQTMPIDNLQYLGLEIKEGISVDLSFLTNLYSLDLSDNNISTLDWSKMPKNIRVLNLDNNKITSLNGIEVLSKLETLFISNNSLTSIDAAKALPNIVYIDASSNTGGNFVYGTPK
jgi:Leucine-rich repeat (LRR) protein